jgi:hypothetical protein
MAGKSPRVRNIPYLKAIALGPFLEKDVVEEDFVFCSFSFGLDWPRGLFCSDFDRKSIMMRLLQAKHETANFFPTGSFSSAILYVLLQLGHSILIAFSYS